MTIVRLVEMYWQYFYQRPFRGEIARTRYAGVFPYRTAFVLLTPIIIRRKDFCNRRIVIGCGGQS